VSRSSGVKDKVRRKRKPRKEDGDESGGIIINGENQETKKERIQTKRELKTDKRIMSYVTCCSETVRTEEGRNGGGGRREGRNGGGGRGGNEEGGSKLRLPKI
jgi:hypothetical protein